MTPRIKRSGLIISISLLILLIPLLAMQFTSEVNWGPGDFLVAGILLIGLGFCVELVLRKKQTKTKIALGLGIFLILLLIWIEMAVGIFGTPISGT